MPKRSKIINFFKYICKKCLGYKLDNWKIGISEKNLNEFDLDDIKFFKHGFAEYWADPFYLKDNSKEYIFFERYSYIDGKGCISVGELKNSKLINVEDIIIKNYHLSYPFIFKSKNNFFLIPETHESKRLEIYTADKFPYKWKLLSTALNGKILADPTIISTDNEHWLFVNETTNKTEELNENLNIYKIEDLLIKNYKPHNNNPVIKNLNGGRNAGKIEKINGKLIRPSQINKKNEYGFGLRISEIEKINLFEFKEKLLKEVVPSKNSKIKGIHHLSFGDGKIIVDCNFK